MMDDLLTCPACVMLMGENPNLQRCAMLTQGSQSLNHTLELADLQVTVLWLLFRVRVNLKMANTDNAVEYLSPLTVITLPPLCRKTDLDGLLS